MRLRALVFTYRKYTGVDKIALSKGLGTSLEYRLAHLDADNSRIAINSDDALAEELSEFVTTSTTSLQLIILPKDIVFAKNSSTVVIDIGAGENSSTSENSVEKMYTLSQGKKTEINSLLNGGSKIVVGFIQQRKITMHKKTVHVDWPYYIKCGQCGNEVAFTRRWRLIRKSIKLS